MVTKEQLADVFLTMNLHGITKLKVVTADCTIEAESDLRLVHDERPGLPESLLDEDLMTSTPLVIREPESVYDDPDLYPDGVDPVAEMRERTQ